MDAGESGSLRHLDRHLAPEIGVLGAIDHTHAALAELGGDLEVGQGCTDQLEGILTVELTRAINGLLRVHLWYAEEPKLGPSR